MDKIDIITFLWFVANHDTDDVLDMELQGIVEFWESTSIAVEDILCNQLT